MHPAEKALGKVEEFVGRGAIRARLEGHVVDWITQRFHQRPFASRGLRAQPRQPVLSDRSWDGRGRSREKPRPASGRGLRPRRPSCLRRSSRGAWPSASSPPLGCSPLWSELLRQNRARWEGSRPDRPAAGRCNKTRREKATLDLAGCKLHDSKNARAGWSASGFFFTPSGWATPRPGSPPAEAGIHRRSAQA
jgi:hypothetical protein